MTYNNTVNQSPEARHLRLTNPRNKMLFRLYNERRLTHAQIAAKCGLSDETVRKIVTQYVRDLRAEALDSRASVNYT